MSRGLPALFCGAHDAPGDAVTGIVQAAKGALEALDIRQVVLGRHKHIVHDDFTGDRSAQGELTLDFGCAQSFHPLLEDEATDHIVLGLCPDDEDICKRAVADPHF